MNTHGQPVPLSGVLGGGVLKVDDYAGFVAREYLAGYLPAGGAAVKVAVVGRLEVIDPARFGVTVARNRGFFSKAFSSESEAWTWLLDANAD